MSDPIIIVGGGLGGLTAALALGRRGFAVHVIEQAPEIAPIGYGIQLGPNVFHVLEWLGVKSEIMKVSHLPPAIMMVDALTGEPLIDATVNSGAYWSVSGNPTSSSTGQICTAACWTPAAIFRTSR